MKYTLTFMYYGVAYSVQGQGMSETPETGTAPAPVPATDGAETRAAIERAAKEYPKGLQAVAEFAAKILRGNAIFHAAYAAEKVSKESARRVITQLYRAHHLEGADIPHAAEADKKHGPEAAKSALDLGFRRSDIPPAAASFSLWPSFKEGAAEMAKMVAMFKKIRADIHEADIRYAALTLRHLDMENLERALRDRHAKNDREPWLRGSSIPIVAHCYRLSGPHTGPAIDECRRRGTRRERIGYAVLAAIGRRFKKTLPPPTWLQ